jgi:superfamily II DNA or RNA helicase
MNETDRLQLILNSSGNKLRACQKAAVLATYSHFMTDATPAVLCLPTGSGKTVIQAALHFLFQPKRFLTIVPNIILRGQTRDKVSKYAELLKYFKAAKDSGKEPNVFEITHRRSNAELWEELKKFNGAVAHPASVSDHFSNTIAEAPKDLFDFIFVDEAQHFPSQSWKKLASQFPNAKIVLFSATPFRTDRLRANGKLVYEYSMQRAVQDGIYREINYLDAYNSKKTTDDAIAAALKKASIGKKNFKAIVRTNRIAKIPDLTRVYSALGFSAFELHSDMSEELQDNSLLRFKDSGVAVIITVGMASEGFDFPELDAICLHEVPRSLPSLIQLVGRLSRAEVRDVGLLISSKDRMKEKMIALFNENNSFSEIIPRYFSKLMQSKFSFSNGSRSLLQGDINFDHMAAFKVVLCYRYPKDSAVNGDFKSIKLDQDHDHWSVCTVPLFKNNLMCIATLRHQRPSWLTESSVENQIYDLHIVKHFPRKRLIMLLTTHELIAQEFLKEIIDRDLLERIPFGNLATTVSDAQEIISFGALLLGHETAGMPAYKSHFGRSVGDSFTLYDSRYFVPDYIAGMKGKLPKGISPKRSKLWELERESLGGIQRWFEKISSAIEKSSEIGKMPFLPEPYEIIKYTKELAPVSILMDERFLYQGFEGFIKTKKVDLLHLRWKIKSNTHTSFVLEVWLGQASVHSVEFDLSNGNWKNEKGDLSFKFEGDVYPLPSILEKYEPVVHLTKATYMKGRNAWKPKKDAFSLIIDDIRDHVDWSNVTSEVPAKSVKKLTNQSLSVLGRILDYLPKSKGRCLVWDDDRGEFADIVLITKDFELILFHCKFRSTKGVALNLFEELTQQNITKLQRLFDPATALALLETRINAGGKKRLLEGNLPSDAPSRWKSIKVVLVQNGLSKSKLENAISQKDCSLAELLFANKIILQANRADFEIWCSP